MPDGPKVIVTVDCCGGRVSLSDVIAGANEGGIAIFDMGSTGWADSPELAARMKALAANTGGIQVKLSNVESSRAAIPTMASWLKNGYRISIPPDAIDDCDRHRLTVTVHGESTSATFSRCDVTPEPFNFNRRIDAPAAKRIRSNAVTITGIDIAVTIRVYRGEYSNTTAASGGREVDTLLIVGAESSWFVSSTVF